MLFCGSFVRNIPVALTLGALSGCAHQSSAAPLNPQPSTAANAGTGAASSNAPGRARAFIVDVLAGGAGLELRYPLVMLGPALYAEIKAIDPSVEQLGTSVSLMNADNVNAAQEARVCVQEACAKLLRAKGVRDALRPFAKAQFRAATPEERRVMLDRSPESIPKDAPASVAVAGTQLLGVYALEASMVWVELISKPSQTTVSPDADAPSTPEQRALDAAKCLKIDSIHLDQAEEVFADNTSAKDLADGVVGIVGILDALLLEKKSQATGLWTLRFMFGKKGISKVLAPPKPGVDPSVVARLGEKSRGHAPVSAGPELSFGIELTLQPCSK